MNNMLLRAKAKNDPKAKKKKDEIKTEKCVVVMPKHKIENIKLVSVYQPTDYLNQMIIHSFQKYSSTLNGLIVITNSLSDLIYKKKMNIREIEVRMKNEIKKKEKEIFDVKKTIEDKVDLALDKANKCLEQVKQLGKVKGETKEIGRITSQSSKKFTKSGNTNINGNDILSSIPVENSKSQSDPAQSKPKTEIEDIIFQNIDKYNDSLIVNEASMNTYFFSLTKAKNRMKEIKDKLKRLRQKAKNVPETFAQIYKRSALISKERKFNLVYEMNGYDELNLIIQILSIIRSELFEKLYLKIILCQNDFGSGYLSRTEKEECIYDVFSLWYLFKSMKNMLSTKDVLISNICRNAESVQKNANPKICQKGFQIQKGFYKKYIIKNLESYLKHLYEVSKKNKSTTSDVEINESEIFTKEYFNIYPTFLKLNKISLMKYIEMILTKISTETEFMRNKNLTGRDELIFFRNSHSIISNNGTYLFNISYN